MKMKWGTNRNYKGVPCKDCERKGCGAYHSECELYKMWKEQNEKLRIKKNERLTMNMALSSLHDHRISTKLRKA